MLVFHGSDIRIDKIDLAKSEFYKDFGRGFYVTNIRYMNRKKSPKKN